MPYVLEKDVLWCPSHDGNTVEEVKAGVFEDGELTGEFIEIFAKHPPYHLKEIPIIEPELIEKKPLEKPKVEYEVKIVEPETKSEPEKKKFKLPKKKKPKKGM